MSDERQLYLARGKKSPYGYTWPEKPHDGPYSTPEGVAKAAKLYERIFNDEGPFVMIEVHPIQDSVSINEDDAEICRRLVTNEFQCRRPKNNKKQR